MSVLQFPSVALVKREFLTSLRQTRTFALLVATVVVTCVVLGLFMLSEMRGMPSASDLQGLFFTYVMVLFVMSGLFVPVLSGVSVCVEKQQESFDLLAMSLVRPSGIIFAKMLNATGLIFLMMIATLPLLGVMFFFVGLDLYSFVVAFVQLFFVTIGCASVGLLASVYCHRTMPALALSFLGMMIYMGLIALIVGPVSDDMLGVRWTSGDIERFMITFSPFFSLVYTLIGPGGATSSNLYFVLGLVYQAVITFACLWWTLRLLRRPAKPAKVDGRKPIDDVGELAARRKKWPYYLVDPQRRKAVISDERNPMFVKELYSGLLGGGAFRIRLFYVCAMGSLIMGCMPWTWSSGRDFMLRNLGYALLYETALVLMVVPAVMASTLAKEEELGNLDMLRTTLLRPWEIISGKVLSAMILLAPILLGVAAGTFPILLTALIVGEFRAPIYYGVFLIALVVDVFFVVGVSLAASVRCRKTMTAVVASYVVNLVLLVGIPTMIIVVYDIMNVPQNDFSAGIAFFTSPIVAQFYNYEEYARSNSMGILNSYWVATVLFTAFLSGVLVWASTRVFAQRSLGGAK